MKNKYYLIAIIIIIIWAGLSASAQSPEPHRFEIFGGFSFNNAPQLDEVIVAHKGWTAGAAVKLKKWVAIYGEFGRDHNRIDIPPTTYYDTAARTSMLGGLRFYLNNKTRFTPFVNGGVGYVRFVPQRHDSNGNKILTQELHAGALFVVGGGVDLALNKKRTFSWRNSAEFRRVEPGYNYNASALSTRRAFQFATGIVFNF